MAQPTTHNSLQLEINNRQILKIALPISLAILIPQFNFITNNIFLGHYNTESLAIAGITGVYYLIFASIGFGLNNGLQALIARRAGENRPGEIGKLFTQGVYTAMIIAIVGILLTWFISPVIFRAVINDPVKADNAIEFLRIRIWGLPFLYIYQMRNALLVGTNQSKYLVWGTLAEAAANIVFDYLFIFGKLGFPELGFNGAAVASIIAEFIGMFVIYLVIHKKGIAKRFSLFSNKQWHRQNASLIANMSAPLVFQHAISVISWEFFFILIERNHSDIPQAISNTMRNIFGIFGACSWAFASTCNAMVSNIIGQGKKEKVQQLVFNIAKLSTGITLVIFVLLNIAPRLFLSVYGQGDEFIRQGIPVIRVVSVAMIFMSFSVVWLYAVTGTGNTRITFLVEALAIILYSVYVFVVLEKLHLSISIGWMSEWLYWTALFLPSFLYMRSGRWKKKVI